MKNVKNRIFGNWKSSLLGSIIIIMCFVLVFFQKASFADISLILLLGFGLLGVKDPQRYNLKMIVLIGVGTCLLSSCSPQYRLKRLLKHHPELTAKEAITIRDTIVIEGGIYDTIFKSNFDTITIEKERFRVQLIKHDSLIYLSHITPADTVYIDKTVMVDKIITPKKEMSFWDKFLVWVAVLSFSFFVIYATLIVARR